MAQITFKEKHNTLLKRSEQIVAKKRKIKHLLIFGYVIQTVLTLCYIGYTLSVH